MTRRALCKLIGGAVAAAAFSIGLARPPRFVPRDTEWVYGLDIPFNGDFPCIIRGRWKDGVFFIDRGHTADEIILGRKTDSST